MPVQFLTPEQRASYGRYAGNPQEDELARYFYLDDADRKMISSKRGDHNRQGFALQLTTVRFLGTFLADPFDVPESVLRTLTRQLGIEFAPERWSRYQEGEQKWEHVSEIKAHYGFGDWDNPRTGFRLSRWLHALCWTGTERPGVLFDRATSWLLAHKVILPGCSTLERFVSRLRHRVEERLWKKIGQGVSKTQRSHLENLLTISEGRSSKLNTLRTGPVRVSGPSLVKALHRLKEVRYLGIKLPSLGVPPARIASLSRFAEKAKVTAISRLPPEHRLATLVAFVHRLEATAQDDAVEVLEMLLTKIFNEAKSEDKKSRLRDLKDLDQAATVLAKVCRILLEDRASNQSLDDAIFTCIPREELKRALDNVESLVRPPDDVYYRELEKRFRSVRRFLPTLLKEIQFGSSPEGADVSAAYQWLSQHEQNPPIETDAPQGVITPPWKEHVIKDNEAIDLRAYTFCVLDGILKSLRRRDVFVSPSWRYTDPRANLLSGEEWEKERSVICRSLGLGLKPEPVLESLSSELDRTYRAVSSRLNQNSAVRFETVDGKEELIVTPLDKIEEPESLKELRKAVVDRLPRVDLPEILLEISSRTEFTNAFTHLTERAARAQDLNISLCAVLVAEACNTGPEPLVRHDVPALRRERLSWVNQNYFRDETLVAANELLVAAQNRIALAHAWGGGEVASADGIRFVVPVRTVHAGNNPKYFGTSRGVTWYNLMSDQCTGLNAMTVPGTLRDSLILLAVVLEQETEIQPTQIMTDTGAYSDVVFGLFRLLGYHFSPRLADIGGTRFWRIDPKADYGELNALARQRISTKRIKTHWEDLLRLAGSLKLGRVSALDIMRTLQVGDRPTPLALALAELGRIEKTIHCLNYLDDENHRRSILLQLNRGEGRHSLARDVFHGKRGELRQQYREGQEDQLSSLGLVVNIIVLWNTLYMDAALTELRDQGYPVREEDVARLSPFIHESHINLLGRYSFAVPDAVARGELRPLRTSDDLPRPQVVLN